MDNEPQGGQRPGAHWAGTVTAPPRPVAAWDITDEEISEWQHSHSGIPGMVLAGYTAAAIRDGKYSSGELFPPDSQAYREVTRQTVDKAMAMLAERGMVRKSGGAWYPVTPGRIAPSTRRAITTLLASRQELPPPWPRNWTPTTRPLDTMHPGTLSGRPASQAATRRPNSPEGVSVSPRNQRCTQP